MTISLMIEYLRLQLSREIRPPERTQVRDAMQERDYHVGSWVVSRHMMPASAVCRYFNAGESA
jgi:hypothetical protein